MTLTINSKVELANILAALAAYGRGEVYEGTGKRHGRIRGRKVGAHDRAFGNTNRVCTLAMEVNDRCVNGRIRKLPAGYVSVPIKP